MGYSTGMGTSTELMCDNGTLSAPIPICYDNCEIEAIPFSDQPTAGSLNHNASIVIACNMGYSTGMGTSTELMCDNGTLSAPIPICYDNCEIEAIPFSDQPTAGSLNHNASIVIACNMGYSTGMGTSTELMCDNGTLSAPIPICYDNCEIEAIPFSDQPTAGSLNHNASIVIACNMGYSTGMGTSTELMCDNGTLSAPIPICYDNCEIEAIPFSDQPTAGSLNHNASIVIACNMGYSTGMGTSTELMCDNGTLSAPIPICYDNCEIEAIPFSDQPTAGSLNHNASIVIACNMGYSTGMGTSTELMCDNGTLSAPIPICYDNCEIEAIPFSDQPTAGSLNHNASIVIACNMGYSTGMGTSTELMCDNGTLSAPIPICYDNCEIEAIPFSDQPTAGSLNHNASIVIACNMGYSTGMGTSTELMCDNGTLSAPIPICYDNCEIEAIPFSDQPTAGSLNHNASIVIACNMGYSTGMGTSTELMCDNGTLSAPIPICYDNCEIEAIPFSDQPTAGSLNHNASIVIACNMGYSTGMGTSTELMCDNGTLSAPIPICYDNCEIEAIPFSDQPTAGSLNHNASIVIACNMGYSTGMGTSTELMCDNGTLSAPIPICYDNCEIEAIPFSDQPTAGSLNHNASIVIACNMGYSTGMGTSTELMCDNGTLSAPIPICYEKCDVDAIPFSNQRTFDSFENDTGIVIASNIGCSTGETAGGAPHVGFGDY
ncbi:uncharacterized protein LOC121421986 [Lytechinus variegatus]|uniref:uncharacterized protein LOC121421986 n=1 Tax=Lytechinus variegatus TaxID=7654 RepID=UPI001BB133D7|nr:uncharacterized protein LOC121421986 [Lytechinus variegatus]